MRLWLNNQFERNHIRDHRRCSIVGLHVNIDRASNLHCEFEVSAVSFAIGNRTLEL